MGLTHQAIAHRLRTLTEAAKQALGGPVVVDNLWRVVVLDFRGHLPCPWGHAGLYPKTHVAVERLDTGETLQWTDLSIHLIESHGFYQGFGSPYRLDPHKVASCGVLSRLIEWPRKPATHTSRALSASALSKESQEPQDPKSPFESAAHESRPRMVFRGRFRCIL